MISFIPSTRNLLLEIFVSIWNWHASPRRVYRDTCQMIILQKKEFRNINYHQICECNEWFILIACWLYSRILIREYFQQIANNVTITQIKYVLRYILNNILYYVDKCYTAPVELTPNTGFCEVSRWRKWRAQMMMMMMMVVVVVMMMMMMMMMMMVKMMMIIRKSREGADMVNGSAKYLSQLKRYWKR